jgi:hypothetical protein
LFSECTFDSKCFQCGVLHITALQSRRRAPFIIVRHEFLQMFTPWNIICYPEQYIFVKIILYNINTALTVFGTAHDL